MSEPKIIFHIPHSSTFIPDEFRSHFSLSDVELTEEIRCMTDWHTAELFSLAANQLGTAVEFSVSRLLVDPERFHDDEQECMSEVGMGVLYNRTSTGDPLRELEYTSGEHRERLLGTYFFPHHQRLFQAVNEELESHGRALIVDCHSFPCVPLPYELDQKSVRPHICIGTDVFHTPQDLSQNLERCFSERGHVVGINAPFSGAIVPTEFYGTNPSVHSIMIEVNRGIYMDEETTERRQAFAAISEDIAFSIAECWTAYRQKM